MSSETDRMTSLLPDTPGAPEDMLDAAQLRQVAPETSARDDGVTLRAADLIDPRFAVASPTYSASQASIAPHIVQPQPARAPSHVSDDPYHLRPDYEFSRLTLEQRENVAAMLAAGGRWDAARAMGWYSFRGQNMPRTWSERGRGLLTTSRELATAFGQRLGILPVAHTITAPPEVRTVRQATPYVPAQPSRATSYQQNLRPQPAYTPPLPPRPVRGQGVYMAAAVAPPAVARRYDVRPAPMLAKQYTEQLISPAELARLLPTINPNPPPRQYPHMNLEAAAAVFRYTPDGVEALAIERARIDAERAPTVQLPAIPVDENGVIIDRTTGQLPAVALDRYGRIATDLVTKELPALPTDPSGRLLRPLEEVLAEEDARNKLWEKLGTINEAIFLNFGQPADRLRIPLPPSGVNKQHGSVASRALKYIRAISEDSPESNLTAALQMAEQFIQPEELLPLVTNAMAIASISKVAKGEPLVQLATAVANGLERAAQHHIQVRLENSGIHTNELPAHFSAPVIAAPRTEAESPVVRQQPETVDKAIHTAAQGLEALSELYRQHSAAAKDWVNTPGFINSVGYGFMEAYPDLYDAAARYFSLRGVRMTHIVTITLLAYEGPRNTADFLHVLQRSLSKMLAESNTPNPASS